MSRVGQKVHSLKKQIIASSQRKFIVRIKKNAALQLANNCLNKGAEYVQNRSHSLAMYIESEERCQRYSIQATDR
jgi:hypothetical protein